MATIVGIDSRRGLRIEVRRKNQTNKSKLVLYKPLLHFYSHFKQLYISNKTEHFSYKGGCDVCGHTHIEVFKRRAAWATDKWLWVFSNIMLFKTVIHTTKKLKNKTFLSLNNIVCVAM